ncbi:ribosomal protein L30, ferredoxin-like fold domain-containing protein [Zychaea mexicana]|uniref:ribosomal protein L30, ferredoxin-like fold domain-containing protein n=1 Tax=Zychaea mexicana TaxID=64656 RepID=UPI0022FDBEED|nr:ribosomal protein L30, ferredoxin-like fold domain-containing protein [Zychaea mexicana]KAI9489080.1 ribosomal protein L30, ferredoxin-like fold domain-containing protein [Zychaea mexicana]
MVSYSVPTAQQVFLPETLLKKQKASDKAEAKATEAKVQQRKARIAKRREIVRRSASYRREYQASERKLIQLHREAKANGSYYIPSQRKLLLVVRIRGINNIPPKPRKVLQLLRLLQINNAVFVRANKATLQMLQLVIPYVTFGEPNLKTIRELIYKRGFGKINKQRIPLHDNALIEQSLGKHNIISMEDLVHEIATVGANFKQANAFLWPFKLSNPNGGWRTRKLNNYVEGGDQGDRERFINNLVQSMN